MLKRNTEALSIDMKQPRKNIPRYNKRRMGPLYVEFQNDNAARAFILGGENNDHTPLFGAFLFHPQRVDQNLEHLRRKLSVLRRLGMFRHIG